MVRPNREAVVSKLAYMLVYFYASLCKFRNSALWASVMVITKEIQPSNQKLVWKRFLISPCDILADVVLHFILTNVQCSVSGCHAVFRQKDHEDHVYTAALSHMALQAGEVERLRRILYHNVGISWTISICINVQCTDFLSLTEKGI